MKSLEIIDKNKFEVLAFGGCVLEENELEQIKDELEVLEIIRKKDVNVYFIKFLFKKIESLEDILFIYNGNEKELTMEELLKLKKWLEEQEQ